MVFIEKEFDFEKPDNFSDNLNNYLRARCSDMGQEILNPVDVAGWQENHDWISTGTLPMRWEFSDYLLLGIGLRIKNNLEIMQLVLLELKKPTC